MPKSHIYKFGKHKNASQGTSYMFSLFKPGSGWNQKKAACSASSLLDQGFIRITSTFAFQKKDTSKFLSWKVKCTLCVVDKWRPNLIRGGVGTAALTQASGFQAGKI